jgi:Flp pilus assembly protein TadG
MRNSIKNPKEKGVTLIIGVCSLIFIVPMMGLAIDVGFLYAVKAKLQAAVDGASLASARALSIGSTLSSQTTSAQNNAVTWFNANFPAGYFGTYNTVMGTGNVNVFAGTGSQAQVRNVTVTATTQVDTLFMRFLGFTSTTVGASGNASRRTVVAMLVLDRSGSMCWNGSSYAQPCTKTSTTLPCYQMIQAAKMFTGQFAENSDYIGLVSFSDNAMVQSAPVQDFQSILGYSNSSGSGTGLLDAIGCYGGTNTAEGMSLGYQLLYQTNLPGALNVLMLETDGLPNSVTMNFWDTPNLLPGLNTTSNCLDLNNKKYTGPSGSGFKTAAEVPSWSPLTSMTSTSNGFLSSNSYYSNIPAGMIGTVSSDDPADATLGFWATLKYFTTSTGSSGDPFGAFTYTGANGCASDNDVKVPLDIGWFPSTDVFGNSLNPTGYTYESVTTDAKGHLTQSGVNSANWKNYHLGVLNATDNSAYNFRGNTTIPATVFAIGLGGNSTTGPPDPVLLQRMANDPNGDEFNTTGPLTGTYAGAYYYPCANSLEKDAYGAACVNYSGQPQGTFIYAPDSTYLSEAFLRISSQVLRLSK